MNRYYEKQSKSSKNLAERKEDSEYDLKYKKEDNETKKAKMEQKREQL